MLLALAAGVIGACGGASTDEQSEFALGPRDDDPGHVHAVGVDPKDGSTFVAAHTGLFRARAGARRASRVGDERRDVMGFTVVGPGSLAGSGHPDLRSGGPSSVGFIRSADGGRTWRTVSLSGEADLHALAIAGPTVYGFDALNGVLRASDDGGRTWRDRQIPPALSLAIDPQNAQTVVVSTERGVLRSTDGGRGFRPYADDVPPSHLTWTDRGLTAIGVDQVVRRITDDGAETVGEVPAQPAAASSHDDDGLLLVALNDGSVLQSSDGRNWQTRLGPTTG